MKLTNRYSLAVLLVVLVLPIIASGCILVVEEDDGYGRHRHLHGTHWTLEIVFYRTQTIQVMDRSVDLRFDEGGAFSGSASCGDLSGSFEVDDNGNLSISRVSFAESCQGESVTELFTEGMRAARTYEADENALRIATNENGYLTFSSK